MNFVQQKTTCTAIVLGQTMASDYENNFAANCWLKNATDPKTIWSGVTLAVLKL